MRSRRASAIAKAMQVRGAFATAALEVAPMMAREARLTVLPEAFATPVPAGLVTRRQAGVSTMDLAALTIARRADAMTRARGAQLTRRREAVVIVVQADHATQRRAEPPTAAPLYAAADAARSLVAHYVTARTGSPSGA